jgi:division protein CdvB (Snf7/Vps24/ESCRT-III family)
MQTLKSTQAMADAMRGATRAMGAMNKQMNLPALTKIMREFERQNERMEMTSEMMGDAVDDAFEVLTPARSERPGTCLKTATCQRPSAFVIEWGWGFYESRLP